MSACLQCLHKKSALKQAKQKRLTEINSYPYPLQSLVSRLWKSMRWGLYLCMRAQKARPSLQLEDMSIILTPG